jgi:hypothetical protein
MVIQCPRCGREIPFKDVNIRWDLATCREWGAAFSLSARRRFRDPSPLDRSNFPAGVTIDRTPEGSTVRASTRDGPAALCAGIVTVLWSGLIYAILWPLISSWPGLDAVGLLKLVVLGAFVWLWVLLVGRRPVLFGSLLSEERRDFVMNVLGQFLSERH